jgi:hypothetical protein
MADNLTIYGLKHKKARLLGERKRIQQRLAPLQSKLQLIQAEVDTLANQFSKLDEQIIAIAKTLEVLGNTDTVEGVKDCAKWANGQRRGAFKATLIAALSRSTELQTTRQLAENVGTALGIDLVDSVLWGKLRRQTKNYLKLMLKAGEVKQTAGKSTIGGSLWQRV